MDKKRFEFLGTPLQSTALADATAMHLGQFRDYSGDPYITHPVAVARTVYEVGGTDEDIAASLLHDVVDDCGATEAALKQKYGYMVTGYVMSMSLPPWIRPGMNRAERKRLECDWLAQSAPPVHTIKLADMLHNVPTILAGGDANWKKTYMGECVNRMAVLRYGHPALVERMWEHIINYRQSLKGR